MRKFLQENRTFIVLALTVTILALLKVGNVNAQTVITIAQVMKHSPDIVRNYELTDAPKILAACVSKDGKEFIPFNTYFRVQGNSSTFNRMLSDSIAYCKESEFPTFYLITHKK